MNAIIAPSLICVDLCNIRQELLALQNAGVQLIHGDFIDGYFSPSCPIGIDCIKRAVEISKVPISLHIMANTCEKFLDMLYGTPLAHVTFHIETCLHVDHVLNKLHSWGYQAGVALSPATPLTALDYILEKCDVVTLMLINPGYAWHKSESQIPYALHKIQDLRKMIDQRGLATKIEIDGRIEESQIAAFVEAGANILVSGTSGMFAGERNYKKNYEHMCQKLTVTGG